MLRLYSKRLNIDVADNDKLIKGTSLDDIHDEIAASKDLDSFARMFLIQELAAAPDAAATSYFLTYNVSNGRFVAFPIWDYEQAYGQTAMRANRECTLMTEVHTNYTPA